MPSILSAPAISRVQTERKGQEILYAFYQYWFSGQEHLLAGDQVTFPSLSNACYLFNQQSANSAPNGPQIHTVFTDLRPLLEGKSSAARLVKINAILTIYVKVANPSTGMQSADFEARLWADNLKRIFENGTQSLAQLGIHHVQLRRGPAPVPFPGIQARMLVVTAQFHYDSPY